MNALSNASHPGEGFAQYRARRTAINKQIKAYLRGRMVHVSTETAILPPAGVDAQVDRQILEGRLRDVERVIRKDGTVVRVGRTKGVTWRKPKP
jgi:hypothetical protein